MVITQTGKDPSEPLSGTETLLWAKVSDPTRAESVWAEIRHPGLPLEQAYGTQRVMNLIQEPLDWNEENKRYEMTSDGFTDPGKYTLFFYVGDKETGIISPFETLHVYKEAADNLPPSAFSLLSPENGASAGTTGVLDWEDADDPDGVTYTVLLSKGNEAFSDPIRKADLIHSTCFLNTDDDLTDGVDYYWKVQAIDEYGAVRESEVRSFHTNNTNAPPPAPVQGYVYNPHTNQPVPNATLTVTPNSSAWAPLTLTTNSNGFYSGVLSPVSGTPTNEVFEADVSVSAEGYGVNSETVKIVFDQQNTYLELANECSEMVTGDLNGDCDIDLTDAILALQVLADMASFPVNKEATLTGTKVSMADAVYVLQNASGL